MVILGDQGCRDEMLNYVPTIKMKWVVVYNDTLSTCRSGICMIDVHVCN